MKSPKEAIARFLFNAGISADFLTILGLFFAFLSAASICFGFFFTAGTFLLLSGLCDLLDGAVARSSGKASVFGGILDSTLDRYGDGSVLLALALYATYQHQLLYAGLAAAALLGSFVISYIRARAECDLEDCRVGFWERGERLVYLAIGLLLNHVWTAVLVLAVGTQWTAGQRLFHAKMLAQEPTLSPREGGASSGRRTRSYALKLAAIILVVVFFRF